MVIKDKTLRTDTSINNWKIELAIFFGLTQVQTLKTNLFYLKEKTYNLIKKKWKEVIDPSKCIGTKAKYWLFY